MKSVRNFTLLLIAVIGLFIVTACSGSDGDGSSPSEDGKDTLTYAYYSSDINQDPAFEKTKEIFEEKYPNTTLERQVIPNENYWTKLKTSVGGGSGPDVFLMNGVNFEQFRTLGLIKNIQPLINESGIDMNDYPKGTRDLYKSDGELYGIPYNEGLLALYYNKEIFDKAGIDYPDETWTWEDVEEKGEKLSATGENIYGITYYPFEGQEGLYPLVKQAGGEVINEDKTKSGFGTPETTAAIKFMQELIKEGIMPSADIFLETEPKQLFASGRSAMYPSGSWNVNLFSETLKDKVGVAVLPHNKERGYLMHGSAYVMNAETDKEEKAFELIKILGSLEVQKVTAEGGANVPSHVKAVDTWMNSFEGIDLTAFKTGLENTEPYPVSLKTAEWQEIMDREVTRALMMEISAEEASKNIEEGMNKVLESEDK